MQRAIRIIMLTITTITIAGPASVWPTFIWTNNGSGTDWGTADYWDGPAGFFPRTGDTAIIAEETGGGYPTFSSSEVVAVLTVETNAELTVPRRFTVENRDALEVQLNADLKINGGTLALAKGGIITLTGTLTFESGGGDLELTANTAGEVYEIPADAGGTIDGLGGTVGTISAITAYEPVLIIGDGVTIQGILDVQVALVNNGEVHANRGGSLTLSCNQKTGNGRWKVSNAFAKLVADTVVSSGPCSIVEITAGVLDVNEDWVSCGSVWMQENGGKIEVAADRFFRSGGCGGVCNCASGGP